MTAGKSARLDLFFAYGLDVSVAVLALEQAMKIFQISYSQNMLVFQLLLLFKTFHKPLKKFPTIKDSGNLIFGYFSRLNNEIVINSNSGIWFRHKITLFLRQTGCMEIHTYSESNLHSSSYANLPNKITLKASHSKSQHFSYLKHHIILKRNCLCYNIPSYPFLHLV